MARVTIATLRDAVDEINGWLEEGGFSVRLETGGRNGYQAVDEYSVWPSGARHGSGVNYNVCCGTSRECVFAAYDQYNARCNTARIAALERKAG
jgi:hypothetical protein